jgi:shikimate 5-dehydrogenase
LKKWTALSSTNEDARWQTLSQALNDKGTPNEFVAWSGEVSMIENLEAFEVYDHIRLSSRVAPKIMKHLKVQSSWTTLLGVVDGMNHTPHGWWPLNALYESFGQLLIHLGKDLDTRGGVLVAGAGGAARTAIAAFFKAGFQKFLVTNFEEEEAAVLIREVRERFFGLDIQWVPMEKIVLLPGESSVLVNCTPSVEENALLTELSYLNFLRRPGFLFDLGRGKPSILLQEAHDAGVRLVNGIDIAARTDVLWAKWGFQTDLELAPYFAKLTAALTPLKPDPPLERT